MPQYKDKIMRQLLIYPRLARLIASLKLNRLTVTYNYFRILSSISISHICLPSLFVLSCLYPVANIVIVNRFISIKYVLDSMIMIYSRSRSAKSVVFFLNVFSSNRVDVCRTTLPIVTVAFFIFTKLVYAVQTSRSEQSCYRKQLYDNFFGFLHIYRFLSVH